VRILPVTQVATVADLHVLKDSYAMGDDDIVRVKDSGDGQAAYFYYKHKSDQAYWIKIDNQPSVFLDTLAQYIQLDLKNRYDPKADLPYPNGIVIRIEQGLNDKPTLMVFFAKIIKRDGTLEGDARSLTRFEVADLTALKQLPENKLVDDGVISLVGQENKPYVFFDGDWFAMDKPLQSASTATLLQSKIVNSGAQVQLIDGSQFIPSHGV